MFETLNATFSRRLLSVLFCGVLLGSVALAAGVKRASHFSRPQLVERTLPSAGTHDLHSLDDVIISEDFETVPAGQLPNGWTRLDLDSGSTVDPQVPGLSVWKVYAEAEFAAHSGTHLCGNHYNDNQLPNDDWLILPPQNLTGTMTLSYWIAAQQAIHPESYEVRVSTTGLQPADFTNLIYDGNDIPATYVQHTHDLSAFAGAPFWIAFHHNSVDEFVIKLDDVLLTGVQAGEFGAITGHVTDQAGQDPVAGAVITAAAYTTITGASGYYSFSSLPVGSYDVTVSHVLFVPDTLFSVNVTSDDTTIADAALDHLPDLYLFTSIAVPIPITDGDTSRMEINVPADAVVLDVDVIVNILHTWDGDLDLWLEAPWGARVHLVEDSLGDGGDNFINTRFDDEALHSFFHGGAPYTGSFRPVEPLSLLDNRIVTGNWALIVFDNNDLDVGLLQNFSLLMTLQGAGADENVVFHPTTFSLSVYPNPFNAGTQFGFTMAHPGRATLILYNVTGQEVARLVDGQLAAGGHAISFAAVSLPSGVYVARLESPDVSSARKVILLR